MIKLFISKMSHNLDIHLLSTIIVLVLIGIVTLVSATQENLYVLGSQLFNIIVGLLVLYIFANHQPRRILFYAPYFYLLCLILLFLVSTIGIESHGAKRWLDLGVINFQPSELMKIALPLFLGSIYHHYQKNISIKAHTLSIIAIVIPFLIIHNQPDLGTAIMIVASGITIIFLAGLPWKLIFSSIFLCLVSAPFIWNTLLDYQKNRILALLDPTKDPYGSGYHSLQSIIAIGSGGFFGKGWGNSSQSNLNFLPETTTDFIFSVFAEEFGFFGIILIFLLYSFIFYRCFTLTSKMQNTFSRLVAASLSVSLFVAIFVNIGMICGIVPIVGIPLPFISYGGTSMVVSMASIGIIMGLYSNKSLIAN